MCISVGIVEGVGESLMVDILVAGVLIMVVDMKKGVYIRIDRCVGMYNYWCIRGSRMCKMVR